MDATTKKIAETVAIGVVKKTLIWGGALLAGHGVAMGFSATDYAAAAAAIVATGWSFWNDYGKGIFLGQLDVLKAKTMAQAAKLHAAGETPVTASQIADQSSKLTTADVIKTIATLPPQIQANVATNSTQGAN